MNQMNQIKIWYDDTPEEIVERITLALIEVGIKVRQVDITEQCATYEFSYAECLEEGD